MDCLASPFLETPESRSATASGLATGGDKSIVHDSVFGVCRKRRISGILNRGPRPKQGAEKGIGWCRVKSDGEQ